MNMSTLFQATSGQAPASAAATNAELARIDAQIELAAKKAALAGMERAAAGQGAEAPPAIAGADVAPARSSGVHVVYEKDGKTIVLDNPTTEQLQQVGIASQRSGDVSGWQLVALTGAVMWGIVAIVWISLAHRRRVRGVENLAAPSADMSARMARIENAIESVAVEVERISEGQRFTSRILSEGAAQPVNNVPEHLAAVLNTRGEL